MEFNDIVEAEQKSQCDLPYEGDAFVWPPEPQSACVPPVLLLLQCPHRQVLHQPGILVS